MKYGGRPAAAGRNDAMETLRNLNFLIAAIFFICYTYQFLYIPVPLLKKKKTVQGTPKRNNMAVLICARNEENVITELIASVRRQSYDAELINVFVMADNCTDNTAGAAEQAGAVVYTRNNPHLVGKGYALEALLDNMERDYPEGFDAYFVFDADNVLEPDYIENMNRTFCAGYPIVTSYRNSKNYGDNWISAGYALWFLRESRFLNHARMLLGTSCAVSGTGFMFSRDILRATDGWHFYLLTEDIEFTIHHVLRGVKIGICPDAVLYDEQPTTFSQSWWQRLRWSRGYLQVFKKYGAQLIGGIFRGRFACYDMSMAIMPAIVLTAISIVSNISLAVIGAVRGESLWVAAESVLKMMLNMYLTLFAIGGIATVSEWKRIHCPGGKKILYVLTFPLFMFTYIPISFAAMFCKAKWKPIEHKVHAPGFLSGGKS